MADSYREGLRKGLKLLGRLVLWTGVDMRDTLAYRERLGDRLTLRERVTLRAWNWIIDRRASRVDAPAARRARTGGRNSCEETSMKIGDVIRLRVDRRHLYPMSSGGTLNAHSLVGPVEWLTFEVRRLLPPLPGASVYPATELRLEGVSRSVAQGFIAADVEEYRHYYCLDCTEITDGDEDGFCLKCGSDNTIGYTDEEAREWAGLPKEG